MQLTSVLVAAATLLAPVSAHAIIPLGRRATGLDVELASVGGTKIKVSVTNTADQEVNLLRVNSFFDESPVQVVNIHNTGMYFRNATLPLLTTQQSATRASSPSATASRSPSKASAPGTISRP
jgi:hypothetical protein